MTNKLGVQHSPEIDNAIARLCANCIWNGRDGYTMKLGCPAYCSKGLLPLTSEGKDCPYFQKEEVEVNDDYDHE